MSGLGSAPRKPGPAFAFALALTALVAPLAIHLFLPVIPAVKSALGLTDAGAQLTFSASLFGMALATLAYGSLSDRYGRRPVLLSGIFLFLVGSLMSAVAESAATLILGRLIQAIGAGCGVTLVRTIARDAYRPEDLVRVITYLTMFYTLGPMISPIIGGILIDTIGWRSVFGFALIAGLAIAVSVYAAVYETRPSSGRAKDDGGIVGSYVQLFRRPRFTALVLQSGFNSGAFLTIASASAGLMKELLQRPSAEFGFYFALFPIGFFSGSLIANRIGNRVPIETMVLAGGVLAMATLTVQASLLLSGVVSPLAIFLPGLFLTMAQGIAISYAQIGAMAEIPRFVGTASGVGVFMQYFWGAAFAQLYGQFADGTPVPMMVIALISGVLCLVSGIVPFALARRRP